MSPTLRIAANGHLSLDFNDASDADWQSIADRLVADYSFERTGADVEGLDEQIYRSFTSPTCTLAAGWDRWSGHYLLSESDVGDVFLKGLFAEI